MIEKFVIEKNGSKALLIVDEIAMILKAGSRIAAMISDSMPEGWKRYRQALIENGILIKTDQDLFTLTRDEIFVNPSEPAAIVLGRNANGYTEWINGQGKNIREVFCLQSKETL